ncbi:Zn-dependent hydrolase [Paracoccus sp. JM45]|uniref:Zn-dependent hydrolase n=1 Tax=Paracoccus sp. JM45 TaxID=2283626 RepID=UPI000E6B97EA|nr:Zn-dependent hydrolase [Paracoccus sp. JM45]RJE81430.1 Zn-dependent hydrolase [Paracoccus sp. JM45]
MTGYADTRRVADLIEDLDQFTATPENGTTRLTYSAEYAAARDFIITHMLRAGLEVRQDAIGNIFGRLAGSNPDLAPVLVGSHLDSVPNGGRFDGPAGIIAGLETAYLFRDLRLTPERGLEVVAMIEEEGARFGGGLLGSRMLTGRVAPADLVELTDDHGVSMADAMEGYGLDPQKAVQAVLAPNAYHSFLELHIEQGPVLEDACQDVAIVDRIVGIAQLKVTIWGRAGHAGTTPMHARRDALTGAVAILSQLSGLPVQTSKEAVLTVGKLEVLPGGANVIPDLVNFTVDLRAPLAKDIDWMISCVRDIVGSACTGGLTGDVEEMLYAKPTMLSPDLHRCLTTNARALGLKYRTMVSGAGHDAMIISAVMPTGLIFVPSRDGISHAPEEWTDYAQLARGIDVIFTTIRDMTGA